MAKFESKLENKNADFLCDAVLTLKTKEECYRFFEDIFTISEVKAIEQRLHVAKLLSEKITYSKIGEETGASTTTISRVNRCLSYGSDGYNTVLNRLKADGKKEK